MECNTDGDKQWSDSDSTHRQDNDCTVLVMVKGTVDSGQWTVDCNGDGRRNSGVTVTVDSDRVVTAY